MSTNNGDDELFIFGFVAIAVPVLVGWGSWFLAGTFTDADQVPANPIKMIEGLVKGETEWPGEATVIAVVLLACVSVTGFWLWNRVDRSPFAKKKQHLRPDTQTLKPYYKGIGPVLGSFGRRSSLLRLQSRQTGVAIGGPGSGKTATVIVPSARAHVGPVIMTSNKGDVVDACLVAREELGLVYICDPGSVTGESRNTNWYWDPITAASTVADARRLAAIWERTSREAESSVQAFWQTSGEELLANLLLAANVGNKSMLDVSSWIKSPSNFEPIELLNLRPEFKAQAENIAANANAPEKQRKGVYATAQVMVAWADDPALTKWMVPTPGSRAFVPELLATSTDTLILLSRSNDKSSIPFITALTAHTLRAAEHQAAGYELGRLNPPLAALLDEAANVCPWPELPEAYSHYGSRGIMLLSIFQSRAQIDKGFGRTGAKQLLGSTNVTLYLGGDTNDDWLQSLSKLCGEYEKPMRSSSHRSGQQGRSRSYSTQSRPVFTVGDLVRLPKWRGLMICDAGVVPIESMPYFKTPKIWKKIRPATTQNRTKN